MVCNACNKDRKSQFKTNDVVAVCDICGHAKLLKYYLIENSRKDSNDKCQRKK